MAKSENDQDDDYKARSVALRLLARREHSRLELTRKLLQRQLPKSVIETVLDDYEEQDWLSDERFAEAYARQRIEAGYGLLRITGELNQRGVVENADTLQAMSLQDWSDQAVRLRRKRFGLSDLHGQLEERLRQMRFLQRRGFTQEQINAAMDAVEPA
ncbi:regulatory protein RecX [Marinobacter sp. LV10MA510-1]|uniref:regulatory protein RecX n=1 Tax=Marinobacter sp. LV10MA510-1 TaxID=1415567 RepID=UPI000BF3AA7A|nr:regulatory protein RecX [Marinobacter sp. LV10MA510-1]PFG08072.1 regulatory protein [Marinobacter sp. LV10MA510-1]